MTTAAPGNYTVIETGGYSVAELTACNNKLFFVQTTSAYGRELWLSTQAGVVSLADDVEEGTYGSSPTNLTAVGTMLHYRAFTYEKGSEVYEYDASVADGGGLLLSDANPNQGDSYPTNLTAVGNRLYYAATGSNGRRELWVINGFSPGRIAQQFPQSDGGSDPKQFFALGSTLYFQANDTASQSTWWKTDGTTAGTRAVGRVGATRNYGKVGNTFIFSAPGTEDYSLNKMTLFRDRSDVTTIGGNVWQDRNADGTQGTYDAGIVGRTVYIDADNDGILDAGERSTTSGAFGDWVFYDLPAGTHVVRQVIPSGWGQLSPTVNGGVSRTVVVNDAVLYSPLISRVLNSGVIAGIAITDTNHNGVLDGVDYYFTNRTIYLDINNNGVPDATEPSTTSDYSGAFALLDVPAGGYRVRQVVPAGWTESSTIPIVSGTLADKGVASGLLFAADPPPASLTLTGYTFLDEYGTNYYDTSKALAGARLFLDLDRDGVADPNEPVQTSDSTGKYSFAGLDYGIYQVSRLGTPVHTNPGRDIPTSYLSYGGFVGQVNVGYFPTLTLVSSGYDPDARGIRLVFDRQQLSVASQADVRILDRSTNTYLPSTSLNFYFDVTRPKELVVRPAGTAAWVDGLYGLRAVKTSIRSGIYGVISLETDLSIDFGVVSGDATGDGRVNFSDLLVLAANYNTTGATASKGDANRDGNVNFADLLILASHYGTTMANADTATLVASSVPNRDDTRDADSVASDVLI
ncbi:MAG: SdrD B-like domain-containing protein [Tepidisphaeraceae bacterium]